MKALSPAQSCFVLMIPGYHAWLCEKALNEICISASSVFSPSLGKPAKFTLPAPLASALPYGYRGRKIASIRKLNPQFWGVIRVGLASSGFRL